LCGRVELLILDDWGLAPMSAERRRDLLEINPGKPPDLLGSRRFSA
jgi:hypothetical protein